MAQVLQDIMNMAVNFKRSRGYSLPSFDVNHILSYNNHNSSLLYRSSKSSTKETPQSNVKPEKLKCWYCQSDHLKKNCPSAPHQTDSLQSKSNIGKDKQCKLIKSFRKRFQCRKEQVNEITTASEDDSSDDQLNQFPAFKKLVCKDADDMSDGLHGLQADTAIVNEMFIEGFHALYNVQMGELKIIALFDTGASIISISSKFFRSLKHQLKVIPLNRKVVSADGNSLGQIGEVHLQCQLGKVVFHNRFVILDNLQHDIILGLPWQCNYRIGWNWNREGKHFITIKSQFVALSIAPHVIWQLAKTKGQCHIQHRSITWITVKTPPNLNNNSLYEINLDRKLPAGLIPLDIIHNLNNKQPGELVIPLLDVGHTDVKLPKNTILGSLN